MSVEQANPASFSLQLDTCVGWIVPAVARDAVLPSLIGAMTFEDQMTWPETFSNMAEVRGPALFETPW